MNTKDKILVFVVDDEDIYRTIIYNRLLSIGITNVRIFEDGESCIYNLDLKPDIIFLDYELGDMHAPAVLSKIQIHCPSAKVIIVSGQKNTKNLTSCFQYGAYDYIEKNMNAPGKIEMIIRELIEKRQIHKQRSLLSAIYNFFF